MLGPIPPPDNPPEIFLGYYPLGSGVRVSANFQKLPRLVGRLESGVRLSQGRLILTTQARKQTSGDPSGQTLHYRGVTFLYNFMTALLHGVVSHNC